MKLTQETVKKCKQTIGVVKSKRFSVVILNFCQTNLNEKHVKSEYFVVRKSENRFKGPGTIMISVFVDFFNFLGSFLNVVLNISYYLGNKTLFHSPITTSKLSFPTNRKTFGRNRSLDLRHS